MRYSDFFRLASDKGFEKVQITTKVSVSNDLKISNDEVIYNQASQIISYNVVALKNGKTVNIETDYLEGEILDLLLEKASVIENIYEEEFLSDTSNNNDIVFDLEFPDLNKYIDKILSFNNLRDDLVNKVITNLQCEKSYKQIINSDGVDITTPSNLVYIDMNLINESTNRNVMASNSIIKTDIKDIDFDLVFNDLKNDLRYKLEEGIVNTGKYNCIIKNDVLCILLSKMISCLDIEKIHENTSFLGECLNNQVFSDKLSIVEDPLNKDYPGYTLFDDEGTPTKFKDIIKDGVLKTYLYDNKNAIKDNTNSTGNKYGNGIGFRNTYIRPGSISYNDLIKKMDSGLIIDECMGYHASIKLSNGYISLQAFGMIVENGVIKSSFVPVVMTTNYKELFNSIEEIGSDLKFNSRSTASPSILFKDISIASK